MRLRAATELDIYRIAELIFGDPLPEDWFVFGDRKAASRFLMGLALHTMGPETIARTTVAVSDGSVVGVLQTNSWSARRRIGPLQLVLLALRTLGWRIVLAVWRLPIAARTQLHYPEGAFTVDEVFVDAQLRGRGIGSTLLAKAEAQAREEGYSQMAIMTTTSNPARRLYERHGFRVIKTRTDDAFERYTGHAGRVLMVKDLR